MKYQLVLQFKSDSLSDLDSIVAIEDQLIAELADSEEVDGHDMGSGEANIFLITSDPTETFQRAKAILDRLGTTPLFAAAYRPVESDNFYVLWPPELQFFSIS